MSDKHSTVATRADAHASLHSHAEGAFEALAHTLYFWTAQLYRQLQRDHVQHVFFLSREGQPLRRLFDAYVERAGGGVRSYYLEVSRRATLLPSLGPLEGERFETLFRQYRAISLAEFLSSLGLQDALPSLEQALALAPGEAQRRHSDLPTSPLFARLVGSTLFSALYETRRSEQRSAFIDYLRDLAGGALPSTLAVVDVGWKGTIQDHLHGMLCAPQQEAVVATVNGYYVGLVASGAAGPTNTKVGLLFSSVHGRSRGFHVFNENRSLFEVILAADHGSVTRYVRDPGGQARPLHGPFEEGEMLARSVFPVLQRIERRFQALLAADPPGCTPDLMAVIALHAGMVFRPAETELAWFDSVFHVENFGVFERSHFGGSAAEGGWHTRMGFILRLLWRRNASGLGFWPWATLRRRVGLPVAMAYATVRRWQAKRSSHG